MNRSTIAALNRINRQFYRARQHEFSRTRRHPWPGWDRVVAAFVERLGQAGEAPSASVLDLGCGHGRFLRSLAVEMPGPIRYVGVDSSLRMLVEARSETVGSIELEKNLVMAELATDRALVPATAWRFDLAVAFGLLHHIPSRDARRDLLFDIAAGLRSGGIMAVSFWQFGEHARYLRRAVPWEDYNRQAEEPLDLNDLEEGDYLLWWGERSPEPGIQAGAPVRYCHFTDPNEAAELVGALRMKVVDRFASDGKGGGQNLYFVLDRP